MIKKRKFCLVCAGILQPWFVRNKRDVFKCTSCNHIQVPVGMAKGKNGRSIYEEEHAEIFEGEGLSDYYLDKSAFKAAKEKLKFVKQYAPLNGKLLDVGANYGHFLYASRQSYKGYGIEPNSSAVYWSRKKYHVKNYLGTIEKRPKGIPNLFSVITAWDVIEHLQNPRMALLRCRSLLPTGGYLFLSTPDAGSLAARILGKNWYFHDPFQHINLFSKKNLIKVLKESGFKVQDITYFGRIYKVNYVLHRLSYLYNFQRLRWLSRILIHIPLNLKKINVKINLNDVVCLAAHAV